MTLFDSISFDGSVDLYNKVSRKVEWGYLIFSEK